MSDKVCVSAEDAQLIIDKLREEFNESSRCVGVNLLNRIQDAVFAVDMRDNLKYLSEEDLRCMICHGQHLIAICKRILGE